MGKEGFKAVETVHSGIVFSMYQRVPEEVLRSQVTRKLKGNFIMAPYQTVWVMHTMNENIGNLACGAAEQHIMTHKKADVSWRS